MSTTSLVFAAIAAAVVWWLSRQPAGPGPLSPIPTIPVIPGRPVDVPADWQMYQLPAPSPARPGLNPILLGAILLPWGLVAWSHLAKLEPKPDTPSPAPVLELDLRGVWSGETAAEDAAITETILSDLAWFIEDDAKLAEPRLKAGQQLSELRMRARQGATRGVSLAERQPRAIDAISAYLDREIGDKGGPLTPEDRAKWVRAFRAVSAAAGASIR
jgi:hypothetical protein